MTNEITQPKEITPPYLGIAKLEKVFDLVSSRNFDEVSINLFMKYGFGKIDAQFAVSTLRFLGVVDDEGRATESMATLRLSNEKRKPEFEKIFRQAYRKLFAIVSAPQELSSSELLDDFRSQYDLSLRVAKAAIPVFIKLAEYAGLKEEGSIVGRLRKPKTQPNNQTVKNPTAQTGQKLPPKLPPAQQGYAVLNSITMPLSDDLAVQYSLEFNNRVQLDDELNQKWRAALKGLRTIAEEIKPKQNSDPKESE